MTVDSDEIGQPPTRRDCLCPPTNEDCEHPTCPRFIPERRTAIDCAEHLRRLASDLREAGDVRQVRLSEEGVTDEYVTVADELWLTALRLDGRMSNDEPRPALSGSDASGGAS